MIKIGMLIGDRYEILEKIGTGGMSDVYKAKCHKLNRYVAVKVLKQEFSENTNFVSKFHVEAQAAAGLMHPNIVNVYDVGEEEGVNYIVMELVEGITLKNYIEKKARLSVKEAISIAIQVSMGIEAAHNNHIIHRDIKPQNIMISKEGKVKIADFGIAKAATSNTITSNVMGSVHYTSPEQARGGFSDERSDIYSLGCTMFEMLTGRVPFDGETTVAIAIKHIQEDMASPREYVSEIPVCVEQIIFKCTQKSPDRRYQSMAELIVDLKKSLMYPNENFVKIISADTGGATKMISEDDIAEIKQRTDYLDLEEPMRLKDREVARMTSAELDLDEDEELEDSIDMIAPAPVKPVVKKVEKAKPVPAVKEPEDDVDEEYDDDDMDPRMERITSIFAIIVAVVIGVLVILLVANAMNLFENDKPGTSAESVQDENGPVMMIDVVGKNKEEAKTLLNDLGLGTKITEQPSAEYEAGIVISQGVMAGEEVELYTTIDLVVSSGSDGLVSEEEPTEEEPTQEETGVEVADVTGSEEAKAKSALEALGFVVTVTTANSDSVEVGKVISQNPTAGTMAEEGSEIVLTVSSGPATVKVKVPDLRGMTETAAKEKLTNLGLACGTVTEVFSDTVTSGCVVSQSHSPNTEVEKGASVDIQLSKGPEVHKYKYVATLDAPSGYTGGNVTITITATDGDTRTFTVSSFPCAVNETGFKVKSGTITYTYMSKTMQPVIDAATGQEVQEEVTQEVTTSPAAIEFAQE
ncbi:MAG: Stk1 family PASTA domain-containing Ser/Thr kinase [Lachnospiraceae bacterium]|nr:Stk1 family PASTA domain-containing Ser/Thr kinase [Lachnospiraceae bacterium]